MFYQRKANRLKEYDYNLSGTYFITICTKNREPILSSIVGDDDSASLNHEIPFASVVLSEYGIIAEKYIQTMQHHNAQISIPQYVIMPDHIHLLIEILSHETQCLSHPTQTKHTIIPQLIASFKRFTNKEIGFNIWQRSYHDHIIRDEQDYFNRWNYINENPLRWIQKYL